ncbi:hypothetical protein Btru_008137 [Bulinus truncatus]|nr:hypothetical protein Btru_008137 [Bulinus truncatus]
MVLKKSNSNLNSGATQRLTKRGIVKSFKMDFYTEQVIRVSLTVRRQVEAEKSILAEIINKVWDRLEWYGPSPSLTFHDRFNRSFGFDTTTTRVLGLFSVNKRNTWLLPARIQTMMADTEFLKKLLPNLDIKVSQHQEIPNGGRNKQMNKKIHRASQIVAENKTIMGSKNPRRRHTFHNRGIQRKYLAVEKPKPRENVNRFVENSRSSILDIEIHQPFHVDARCANKNNVNRFKKRYCGKLLKSSTKSKGHVNGRYEYVKGYTRENILEETYLALNEPVRMNNTDKYTLSGECSATYQETKLTSFDLCDFIVKKKPKIKPRKIKKSKQEMMEKLREPSDFNNIVKYPKGSFIKVSKDCSESCLITDTFDILNKDILEARDEEFVIIQSLEDENLTPQIVITDEVKFEKEIKDFDQSFVDVTLAFHMDEENNVAQKDQLPEEVKEKIIIGKSYPPCFVVELNESNKNCGKCYLVGKQKHANSSSWHISFQCKNYGEANVRLQNAIYEEWTCFITLSRLLELAKNVKNEMNCYTNSDVCEDSSLTQHNYHQDSNNSVIFCQSDKISAYLTQENETKSQGLSAIAKCANNDNIDLQECPVCLMPFHGQLTMKLAQCDHMFCVKCWQTHVVCGIQQGFSKLTCLAVNCNNVLDIGTVWNLLPFEIIDKWQRQVLEKCIETSPYCNWCPSDTCQNVAMSLSTPLKQQFGRPVTCSCGHSWCGNCQDTPHWPASCDQVAAYKKLLEKAGVNKNFTYGVIDYFIRLKPCPNCEYPIEKNEGCPSMVCRMCHYNFCWNCLKGAYSHVVYQCHGNDDNFVTYNLRNTLVHDLPLKFFTECMESNKTLKMLNTTKQKWLFYYKGHLPPNSKVKVKSYLSTVQMDCTVLVEEVEKWFNFLQNAYEFQEMLYLLLGFALINRSRKTQQLINVILSKSSQLQFITCRLQEHFFIRYLQMVLKKSNSVFNSGATQRIKNGGTWETYKVNQHREQLIYIFFTVSQNGEKRKKVLEKCLQDIWDKLEWKGPSLPEEQLEKIKDPSVLSIMFELSYSSMNKRNMWLLPNRIKSIMANSEFLHKIIPVLDLRFHEHQESPKGSKHNTEKKYYVSKLIAETQPMNEGKKSRKRRTFHHRGIQRHHLLCDNPKSEKTVQNQTHETTNAWPSTLNIIVSLPCYVDARCANKNNVNRFKKRYCEKFLKSSTKSKGHVNGRYEYVKGYTREQILEDTYMALIDPFSPKYEVQYKKSGWCFYSSPEPKTNSFDLCDFIVQNKPKVKKPKRRNGRHAQIETFSKPPELHNVVFKYPKGSFIKVPYDFTESLNKHRFDFPKNEMFSDNLTTDELDEKTKVIQSLEDENVTTQPGIRAETIFETEIKDFDKSFIVVTLAFHMDEENNVAQKDQLPEEIKEKIIIGKSYPPCFVIELNESNKNCAKCYLVGKQKYVNSSSWHISFQCKNYGEANVRLHNAIYEEWTCFITLSRLLELAKNVKNEMNCCTSSDAYADSSLTQHNHHQDSNNSVIFCQSDKISAYLTQENETKSQGLSAIVKCANNDNIDLQECPVCLIPFHGQLTMKLAQCDHMFCVKCWQTHVVCGIQQGFSKLTCLAVNCNNALDMGTIWNLLPFEIIDKWQRQVLEKCIETSPYCNWCPSDTCQNVAMSLSTPLKQQFGRPVTCSCGHSWCGNCQDTPHWPASCDQVAAYKKLLEKAGVNKNFTYGVIDYFIRFFIPY